MNEVIRAILNRTSCRSFTKEAVTKEQAEILLDCALHAPSGMGLQTWKFTAVLNREKIQRLAKAVGKAIGRDASYDMYDPSLLIITSNRKDSRYREVDNACAMENLYLGAGALGLGCVWINQLLDCCDEPDVREILREFGIPEEHGVYGCAAVGHAAAPGTGKERIGEKALVV